MRIYAQILNLGIAIVEAKFADTLAVRALGYRYTVDNAVFSFGAEPFALVYFKIGRVNADIKKEYRNGSFAPLLAYLIQHICLDIRDNSIFVGISALPLQKISALMVLVLRQNRQQTLHSYFTDYIS